MVVPPSTECTRKIAPDGRIASIVADRTLMQLTVALYAAEVSLICILTSHEDEGGIKSVVGLTEPDVSGSTR